MGKKYTTLKDIARSLGVSTTTVYKVLHGHPDISKSTREKVLKAIEEFGYIKNEIASTLRSAKTNAIGFIVPEISNPFYEPVILGMTQATRDRGYDLFIVNLPRNRKEDIDKAIENLMMRRMDGIIIAANITQLDERDFRRYRLKERAIAFGLAFPTTFMDVITPNNFKGGYIATKHLIDIGRKRIAILHASDFEKERNLKERFQGYIKALKDHGMNLNKELIFVEKEPSGRTNSMFEAYDLIRKKIKEVEFDAIFCYNDELAYGAIEALKDENVEIPEDVAIVGYDDLEFSKLISPSLTSVKFDKYHLGYRAVEMLLERLENPSMEPRLELVDVDLVIRESTAGV
ncbi:MAG: LacI family transcriptional regulator [Thermotoga sp.]|nr:MAG: LacI family transcriptional regulator [Thermotoga sp.]